MHTHKRTVYFWLIALFIVFSTWGHCAIADVITHTVVLTTTSPAAVLPGTCITGTRGVHYAPFTLTAPAADTTFHITMTTEAYPDLIPHILIYTPTFDPAFPFSNFVPIQPNFTSTGSVATTTLPFVNSGVEQQIVIVAAGQCHPGDEGPAELMISGVVSPTPPASPVPTVSEWGMILIAILLAAIAIIFMRRQKHGKACDTPLQRVQNTAYHIELESVKPSRPSQCII